MITPQVRNLNGIDLMVIPTDQFKITTIGVQFLVPLEEETHTANALLPYVMMRGSERFPTADAIQKELARLYGASLAFGVGKKGSVQLPSFTLKVVNEKFLGGNEDVFGQSVSLLSDVLFHPHFTGGAFNAEEVNKEKEQHRKRIESLFDDKMAFAAERCLEEMGKGYRFSLSRQGTAPQLGAITGESLAHTYLNMQNHCPVQVMIVGNVDPDSVFSAWQNLLPAARSQTRIIPQLERFAAQGDVKQVVDKQDINQGKLNIGYQTSTTYEQEDYPALVVYNAILGGSATSKLFINVREKASLCYYVRSRLDGFSGLMYIQSGIEVENFDQAKQIIDQQLEAMRKGEISETEMHFAKQSLLNQYRTANDSPDTVIDLEINSKLTGRGRTLDSLIEDVNQVTLEDVTNIAQRIKENTVYFLRN
ncbi:MAG: hypothetical protein JWN30_2598 [Bacilli bacterium]|nr:hypothetical protein [Bacilli bacterium]